MDLATLLRLEEKKSRGQYLVLEVMLPSLKRLSMLEQNLQHGRGVSRLLAVRREALGLISTVMTSL